MKFLAFLSFMLLTVVAYSQEKQIDKQAQVAKLSTVESKIVLLEEKIERVEGRITANPELANDPIVTQGLQELKDELMMLERVQKSVKSYLEDSDKKTENKSDK